MFYDLSWDILFTKEDGQQFKLGILAECEITSSVKNLADTAKIILPATDMNKVIRIQDTISQGDKVRIRLGYDNILENEFEGFVKEFITNDGSLTIQCEDGLFLFRKSIKDANLKPTSVRKIANYVLAQIDPSYTLDCNYDIAYEKFVIYKASGFDVLQKLQEETGADIYFDTREKVLSIRAPYTDKKGQIDYSLQHNIETSSLEYKSAEGKKLEVVIESVDLKGKVTSYSVGVPGGEQVKRKVGNIPPGGVKIMADIEYKNRMQDGYEGSFQAWLIPFLVPGYTVGIYDEDYPEKDGRYYVDAVTTNFSPNGGVRTIQTGIKLSV